MAVPQLHKTALRIELRRIIRGQDAINAAMVGIEERWKRSPENRRAGDLAVRTKRQHGSRHSVSIALIVRCIHSPDRPALSGHVSRVRLAGKAVRDRVILKGSEHFVFAPHVNQHALIGRVVDNRRPMNVMSAQRFLGTASASPSRKEGLHK